MMTRDMELIRKIIEEIQSKQTLDPRPIQIEGVDSTVLARHLELMMNAKLIEGIQSKPGSTFVPYVAVKDLTWAGHDFAAAIQNDTVWKRMKDTLGGQIKSMPLEVLKMVGVSLLTELAKQQTGISS
jgi:hypothetical protein